MLIAKQKKEENIAEYILYMYQIEDIIRAYEFNLDRIIKEYVRPQLADDSFINQYTSWYKDLISKMKMQQLHKTGHLLELNEVLVEISYLHNTLFNLAKDQKYIDLVERANPIIEEFRGKSNLKDKNHIELLFHAMYMKLLLRLQKKEISAETEEAFDAMRIMLAYLSQAYHRMKKGDLDFLKN